MFIKVMLERIYEMNFELVNIEEITDMDDLEILENDSTNITTELKLIRLMTKSEVEQFQKEESCPEEETLFIQAQKISDHLRHLSTE